MDKRREILEGLNANRTVISESNDSWDVWMKAVKNNPTFKKLDKIAKKHNHEVKYAAKEVSKDGQSRYDITISNDEGILDLNIKYNAQSKKLGFESSMEKSINARYDEYKKFIDTVDNARALIKDLDNIDLSKLEQYEV